MSAAENRAVFLSYASQDAETAKRICEALRAVGVEVWFDQNELVGGDAWDAKIRKQIGECALFVPLISAATQARREGYFRLEWRIAAQRTHMMSEQIAFLLPVVIDETRDAEADVPAEFKAVQWTKLRASETPEKFCARVKKLLGGGSVAQAALSAGSAAGASLDDARGRGPAAPLRQSSLPWRMAAALIAAVVVAAFALWQPWRAKEKSAAPASPVASIVPAKPLTEAQQLVEKARKIFDEGDELNRETYMLAEELLKKAETLDVTEGSAWALHAQVSAQSYLYGLDNSPTRREAMLVESARATKLMPDSMGAVLASANVRLATRQEIPALEGSFKQLAEANPQDPQVLRVLVKAYGLDGKAGDASDTARQALRLAPDDPRLKADLVNYLRINNRFAEAEAALTEAKKGRMNARLWAFDSWLRLVWQGDSAGAAASIRSWPSWFFLEDRGAALAAIVFMWNREPAKAIEVLGNFPRDEIEDTMAAGPRAAFTAMAREQMGQNESVRADWRVALQMADRKLSTAPDDGAALHWKAWALARLGDQPAASAIFNQLREKSPILPSSLYLFGGLASLAETIGQSAEVINYLQPSRFNGTGFERPLTKGILRLNPVFAPLLSDPRFQALIDAAPGPEAKTTSSPSVSLDEKSVAVLAFADLSAAHDSEYFSDGISEELLNVLAKVPGLKVTARTSAFFFKGKNLPIPEIAKQLGVAYVVEGSVQRAGDRVKITAQLIKAADGFHVWSDTFTRDAKDVFAVEEEIAGLIAKQLSLKLGASSAAATASVNPEAYELYVQGRAAWNLRSAEGFTRAEQLFNRALELSPNFARAQAALADVALTRADNLDNSLGAFNQRNSPELARVVAQIRRVLALDPESAEAHASLGNALDFAWEFGESERELRRGIALNPNYASAHQWLAFPLFATSQIDDALSEQKRAVELDPLSPRLLDNLGHGLRLAGRYREALVAYDRALALQPSWFEALFGKALTFAALGRTAEAVALARQLPAGNPNTLGYQILVFSQSGLKADAEALLARPDPKGYWPRTHLLLAVGRREEALAALDAASASTDLQPTFVFFEPLYDSIRDEPRFAEFLATLGWTEAHARAQAWRKAHPPEKPETKK